jgi:hypothetical protein
MTTSEEDYILTKEEEEEIFENEKKSRISFVVWKMRNAGAHEEQIVSHVTAIDFEKEINKQELFKRMNSNKHQELWHQEQRKIEKESKEKALSELKNRCDATYMFKLMKYNMRNIFKRELIVNEQTKSLITILCFFLSNDKRFETELGYSFSKGLLLRGPTGIGKTSLVECLSANELNPIHIISMLDVVDEIKSTGEYQIKRGDNKILYLDDVGTEESTALHYGNKINFFKNFIETVYLKNKIFNQLIISTNCSFTEMEEKYGFRVRSRMKDMFNVVDIKCKDMRG